jgi:hypothetical protein
MSVQRRLPAFVAAVAIAGGLIAATASVASATTAVKADPCVQAGDKYHGEIVKSFKIMGYDSEGNAVTRGGTLQVFRSATCQTVWVRTVKAEQYNDIARETGVAITYYDVDRQQTLRVSNYTMVLGALETKAVHAGWHGTAWVEGGFLGDYQFDSGHNVRF